MNKKAILVALIASLGVSFFLWNQIQKKQQTANNTPIVQQEIIKKKVVVCKKRLAARTRLEASMLRDCFVIKELVASSVPALAFTEIASLTNRYTAVTVLPDDIMTPARLLDDDIIPNLARAIPVGKRAVSIAVSKSSSVGGFIQQGDYVDVIATFRSKGETISKIVLQDIQVLAMGNTYEIEGAIATMAPAIAASKAELITLALAPEDLEKLMYLEAGTTFRLVLKNPTDKDSVVQTKGATERIVLKDIGHDTTPSTPVVKENIIKETVENTINKTQKEEDDDGIVEIMFGSEKKREIHKYNGSASKYNKLSNGHNHNHSHSISEAEVIETVEVE